mmetsp:Transcript_4704/g.12313  ORF Transcript_4704/g.12313 Transcript_4704/m.12313 type:complete len:172 (-) Transcript_4704:1134-1649(-)
MSKLYTQFTLMLAMLCGLSALLIVPSSAFSPAVRAPPQSASFGSPLPTSHITFATPLPTTTQLAMAEPSVVDSPTIEKTTEEDKTTDEVRAKTPMWEIRLWNDPFNKREFVARCLAEVCGKSDTESFQIMMHAHKNGMGVIGRYDFEIAELYYKTLREEGLTVDMVPVDDE